jgi:hypothetical protein
MRVRSSKRRHAPGCGANVASARDDRDTTESMETATLAFRKSRRSMLMVASLSRLAREPAAAHIEKRLHCDAGLLVRNGDVLRPEPRELIGPSRW